MKTIYFPIHAVSIYGNLFFFFLCRRLKMGGLAEPLSWPNAHILELESQILDAQLMGLPFGRELLLAIG